VREFGFELALCAHLEGEPIVSRQLGAHVHGRRVLDTVLVEPGPDFEDRAAITPHTIPEAAIESDVGPGRARYWKAAFDCHPERAEAAVDEAVDIGFFEEERRGGRRVVRQTARYPEQWFDSIVGIENKPDLDRPGDLERQLQTDVSLGLVDEAVLATASHVTGAHLNRIPDAVGVWEFDPDTGELTVVRDPDQLPTKEPGLEPLEFHPGRTDVRVASAEEKRLARRRLAERAYGKGWRTYGFPECARIDPDGDGLPYCPWKGRVVRPASDCGADCGGHEAGAAPAVDVAALRADRTPWVADPEDCRRHQAGLDRFGD